MDYIFDSSSLMYLGKIKVLSKIALLRGKKFITRGVYEEVIIKGKERKDKEVIEIENLIESKVFDVKAVNLININDELLGDADKEVLSLAKQINGTAIIDERHGRNWAKYFGIACHGSIYLLLLLARQRIIINGEAIKYLDKMIESGFYLSVAKYKEVLDIINKSQYERA